MGKAVGQVHTDKDAGEYHKGKKRWDHFLEPQVQACQGKCQRFFIFQEHRCGKEGKQAEKKHLFQIVYTFFPFFGGVGTRGLTAHRTASFGNCNLVRMRGIMYT